MILTKDNIKQIDLDNVINSRVVKGKLDEILLIVPTNRRIRSLRKELISLVPGKTAANIYLDTLGTISTKLLLQKKSFKSLSDTAVYVLTKQSISETELKYFSGYSGEIPPGTIYRIIEVISEYKKQGITPEILRQEASSLSGGEKLKALDISGIYENYQNICNGLAAKEIGDIYHDLAHISSEDFAGYFKRCYPKINLVVIDGFDEFSNLEIEIINLISEVKGIKTYINFDYYLYNSPVFSHLDRCYNKLLKKGFKLINDTSIVHLEDFRNIIREKLFLKNSNLIEHHYTNKITRIEAATRRQEIELVAKEIKNLLLEKKAEPHQICVSFNLIEKYSPAIRDIFSIYGVPINLTDRLTLNDSTAVIAIINFFEILENDFYFKNIFRAANNSIFELGSIDFIGLMRISKELKIVSGYNNWINSIKSEIEILKEKESYYSPERFDEEKKRLIKALKDIELIRSFLEPFSKKITITDFITSFKNMLLSLGSYTKIVEKINERSELNLKAASVFIDTIEEVLTLLEYRSVLKKEYPLSFYLERIRSIALTTRYNTSEKSKYGVQVTTLNEIRGLKFDYLFICGLCDGDFPTRYNPEIFFSGSFIQGEQNHLHEDRYHFYQGLSSWRKGLFLTFPAREENKELVESSFLKDFINLFEVTNKIAVDFNDAYYSKEEIQKTIGKLNNSEISKKLFDDCNLFNWDSVQFSLEVAKIRNENPLFSVFSGCLNETENNFSQKLSEIAVEELRNITSQQFSVTHLEQYAACPYKYFIDKVLKVELIEEPSEDIESFEIGTLLHSILFKFYTELKSKGVVLDGCNDTVFKKAEELLFSIAEEKLSEKKFKSPLSFYEHEKILGIDNNRKNSILFKFLEHERENSSGFIPQYFEVSFGKVGGDQKDKELKHSGKFRDNEIWLGGQIDRIEINENEKVFNIVDYKLSGKKPTLDDLKNGLSLQLPLYMYVTGEMLKEKYNEEYKPAGLFIYSLKFKSKEFGKTAINTKNNRVYELLDEDGRKELIRYNEEMINNCNEKMNNFVQNIAVGRFNLSVLEDRENRICKYCNYCSVCRIREVE